MAIYQDLLSLADIIALEPRRAQSSLCMLFKNVHDLCTSLPNMITTVSISKSVIVLHSSYSYVITQRPAWMTIVIVLGSTILVHSKNYFTSSTYLTLYTQKGCRNVSSIYSLHSLLVLSLQRDLLLRVTIYRYIVFQIMLTPS